MSSLGNAEVQLLLDRKQFQSGLRKSKQDMQNFSKQGKKSMSGLGTAIKGAAAAFLGFEAARQAGRAILTATNAASSANEMLNKASVVFGDNLADVQNWSEGLSKEIGRSRYDLIQMASTIQDTFVPMGFAREEAAKLSKQLTELAVDVGSFNDVADTDVMRDFQSALVGNHETVRKYGIILTEARLEQIAFESGVTDTIRELTAQEKVQARLQGIMQGTTDAQGDAARTADSYANQVKAMQASMKDFQIAAGQLFIPMMQAIVGTLTDTFNWLDKVIKRMTDFGDKVAEISQQNSFVGGLAGGGDVFFGGQEEAARRRESDAVMGAQMAMGSQQVANAPAAPSQETQEQLTALQERANLIQMNIDKGKDYQVVLEDTAFVQRDLIAMDQNAITPSPERLAQTQAQLAAIVQKEQQVVQFAMQWSSTMTQAFVNGQNMGEAFLSTLKSMVTQVLTLSTAFAALKLIPGIGGTTTFGSFLLSGLGLGGFRANGGDVSAGRNYVVGERGPELFTPNASGQITSNKNLQGLGVGNINLYVNLDGRQLKAGIDRVEYGNSRRGN